MGSYHLVGIGGSGMSALAQLLAGKGYQVTGSDRAYDQGRSPALFNLLSSSGIRLYPQDGSGVTPETEMVVVSTAVEEQIADVAKGRSLGLQILPRAEVLANLFNQQDGLAVAGTSGKSTVTGMIGHILSLAGLDPTIVNGGGMKNFPLAGQPNNLRLGHSRMMVIESDESDGSLVYYQPSVSVITTISKDHKEISELIDLFQKLADHTQHKIIVNKDGPYLKSLALKPSQALTFSLTEEADYQASAIQLEKMTAGFQCQGYTFHLQVPGLHNISNALAALAACHYLGVSMSQIQSALSNFCGIYRRFDLIGMVEGIHVIDDFAHNPEKIAATLKTAAGFKTRRILVFQPHGFGPTKFLKNELIEVFLAEMTDEDILFMPEIFYAGGTICRDISSLDLVQAIQAGGKKASYEIDKEAVLPALIDETRPGDTIVVMGGRDETLRCFSQRIFEQLGKKFGLAGR